MLTNYSQKLGYDIKLVLQEGWRKNQKRQVDLRIESFKLLNLFSLELQQLPVELFFAHSTRRADLRGSYSQATAFYEPRLTMTTRNGQRLTKKQNPI